MPIASRFIITTKTWQYLSTGLLVTDRGVHFSLARKHKVTLLPEQLGIASSFKKSTSGPMGKTRPTSCCFTAKEIAEFEADKQNLLFGNVVGGSRTEFEKRKWPPESDGSRRLCGQPDGTRGVPGNDRCSGWLSRLSMQLELPVAQIVSCRGETAKCYSSISAHVCQILSIARPGMCVRRQ